MSIIMCVCVCVCDPVYYVSSVFRRLHTNGNVYDVRLRLIVDDCDPDAAIFVDTPTFKKKKKKYPRHVRLFSFFFSGGGGEGGRTGGAHNPDRNWAQVHAEADTRSAYS